MVTRSVIIAFLVFTLLAATPAKADQSSAEKLTVIVSAFFKEPLTKKAERTLSDAGFAEADVNRIITELVAAASSCVVDSLAQQAAEQSIDADQLLAAAVVAMEAKAGDDFLEGLDEDELTRKLDSCILLALENAGVWLK